MIVKAWTEMRGMEEVWARDCTTGLAREVGVVKDDKLGVKTSLCVQTLAQIVGFTNKNCFHEFLVQS